MPRRIRRRDIHGIILLDKRQGVSSNRALQEVKRLFQANKAGHTGSLDPLATGLLPVCLGEATKTSAFMLEDDKRYQTLIQLGLVTDTGDIEGRVIAENAVPHISEQQIAACLAHFVGEIEQIPPMYSALKYQGRKLYELAREGKSVKRKSRKISIYTLECLALNGDLLTLDVRCSKGTYIRTLAEDIGNYLGCGATVKELRRTEVGQFKLAEASTIEQLQAIQSDAELLSKLIAVDLPLHSLPAIYLSRSAVDAVQQGRQVVCTETSVQAGLCRLYHEGRFLGLGEMLMNAKIQPRKLFNLN